MCHVRGEEGGEGRRGDVMTVRHGWGGGGRDGEPTAKPTDGVVVGPGWG